MRTEIKKLSSENSKNIYLVNINNFYDKITLSKDKTGKATNLKLSLKTELEVFFNDKTLNFVFNETLNIENSTDTYKQKNYKKIIKKNFVSAVVEKFILKLLNSK